MQVILKKCHDDILASGSFIAWKCRPLEGWRWTPGLVLNLASSASTILDGLWALENSGFSSEFLSVRSEESLESLDKYELMLNAPDTRDVDEDMTVGWSTWCSGMNLTKSRANQKFPISNKTMAPCGIFKDDADDWPNKTMAPPSISRMMRGGNWVLPGLRS